MADKIYDLINVDENKRIEMIGQAAQKGRIVGVLIDDDAKKIQRYTDKIKQKFPRVVVIDMKEFTKGVMLVRYGPLES